jgi:hypothetical protein
VRHALFLGLQVMGPSATATENTHLVHRSQHSRNPSSLADKTQAPNPNIKYEKWINRNADPILDHS